jgi:hypothetical protein
MPTAVIWGYVLVSINVAQPQAEPWMAYDYPELETCEVDRTALLESVPGRQAWCVPIPKPEKERRYKRLARRR